MTTPNIYEVKPSRLVANRAVPPGSKSLTNRALLLAALAQGESILENVLDAEDAVIMMDALRALGVAVDFDATRRIAVVRGCDGEFPSKSVSLYVGNSGTTARFITAALAFATSGRYALDGKPRMRERPIGDLLAALRLLGREAPSDANNDRPPLTICGRPLDQSPIVVPIAANVSSQFLSGLLMAAPLARREMVVEIEGDLASKPYVEMTLSVMNAFGQKVRVDSSFRRFDGFNLGRYTGRRYTIEPDASAASYFFALPALLGGEITISNLSRHSLQGDVAFVECLEKMGCVARWSDSEITVARPRMNDGALAPLHGVDVDMNSCSDVAQTLAVVALFADSPTTIRNVGNMRVKETDRIAALATELRKFGANVEERQDGLTIVPNGNLRGAQIATYDDHRMAMSFALVGLRIPGVRIENPECVSKTYPEYFRDMEKATEPLDASF